MSFEYVSAVMAQSGSESDGSGSNWILVGMIVLVCLVCFIPSKSKGKSGSQGAGSLGTGQLTAEEVTAMRFQPTKFKEGYDQDEVDDLLERVVRELQRLDKENTQVQQAVSLGRSVPHTSPIITADQVMNQKFSPTKFREGYLQDHVDDALMRVVMGLRDRVSENEQLRRRVGPSQYGTSTTPS
ncbi:DivIVA domain-containing protein [Arthrobacter sp. zg-Y895]|uniref:DivIVA domain-containing protein n=1 Tax=Arthrobacter sp. zg-Y895 TaxID=2886933 RepID=UPI001D1482CE|nr:DivIVA domain-containing protein [Arthrobacter sp. zg-Y895]MCC3301215.1 DivIVA domain-containing protein [Arthrobacter sp. zg-Y895]MCC3302462.1 DivIVA domain-containing protein [Arthrobacter sp. zg-Y895]